MDWGIMDNQHEIWHWEDNWETFYYTNWYDGQPDDLRPGDCASINIPDCLYQWVDYPCNFPFLDAFICEQPL